MKKTEPWITIILPVYNVRPYLVDCIRSIMMQWHEGVEVIAIEDCSSDGSREELANLARMFPIRIIYHERNRGLSAARNTGLKAATGNYIWFLDSDDMIGANAIAKLFDIVEKFSPDLVMCDFAMLRENMQLKHRLRGEGHRSTFRGKSKVLGTAVEDLVAGVFIQGHLHTWSKIAKRNVWMTLNFPEGRYFEDARTTPFLLLQARTWYHMPEPWVIYRQREGSILNKMDPVKINDLISSFSDFGQELKTKGLITTSYARFCIAWHMTRIFMGACKHISKFDRREKIAALESNRFYYLNSSPLSKSELTLQLLRRGWLWRAVRLNYWLSMSRYASKEDQV